MKEGGVRGRCFYPTPESSFQCCGSGSGIRGLFDPWIRSGIGFSRIPDLSLLLLFLDPGSGMGKNQDPGSGINIPDPQHCQL
jgi:hypothetical protein